MRIHALLGLVMQITWRGLALLMLDRYHPTAMTSNIGAPGDSRGSRSFAPPEKLLQEAFLYALGGGLVALIHPLLQFRQGHVSGEYFVLFVFYYLAIFALFAIPAFMVLGFSFARAFLVGCAGASFYMLNNVILALLPSLLLPVHPLILAAGPATFVRRRFRASHVRALLISIVPLSGLLGFFIVVR